jgi:hypothetical protein
MPPKPHPPHPTNNHTTGEIPPTLVSEGGSNTCSWHTCTEQVFMQQIIAACGGAVLADREHVVEREHALVQRSFPAARALGGDEVSGEVLRAVLRLTARVQATPAVARVCPYGLNATELL